MSNISNFTGKFRVQGPEADRIVKRPRATLTCAPCRQAKLGCDKGQPCSSCVKRGDEARCSYGAQRSGSSMSRQSVADQKLAHLETMVLQLMQEQKDLGPTPPSGGFVDSTAPPQPPPAVDPASLPTGTQNGYTGSTHWSSMLDDIHELRDLLENQPMHAEDNEPVTGALDEVIYGAPAIYPLDQIIATHLPARVDVDRLLAVYFSGETFILPILHTGYFQRQCTRFWAFPSEVEPLWLAILFSVCFMAARISARSGSPIISSDPVALQIAAGQCLVRGRYHITQRYAPEALLLYAQSKNFHSLDTSREVGAILAMSIRHAYHLGYHRDPDAVGSFSPFEGEMRRRFWATYKQFDLMVSFQLGLPSNVRPELCDTRAPRNLLDSDFDENSIELPPSRPETEATRLLWFIVKDRQMATFSKVCENALSCDKKTYDHVELLDSELRSMHASVPDVLRTRPFQESTADSPFLIMTRLYIELIYLKHLCVLHRNYIVQRHQQSIMTGAEAAKSLISSVLVMYDEFKPGGQLQAHKWMLNCFTVNDFLLGITTACLAVYTIRQNVSATSEERSLEQQLLATLRRALHVCDEISEGSKDVQRVSPAIRLVLNGLGSNPGNSTWRTPEHALLEIPSAETGPLPLTPVSSSILAQYDPFDFMSNPLQDFSWSTTDVEYSTANGGVDPLLNWQQGS